MEQNEGSATKQYEMIGERVEERRCTFFDEDKDLGVEILYAPFPIPVDSCLQVHVRDN